MAIIKETDGKMQDDTRNMQNRTLKARNDMSQGHKTGKCVSAWGSGTQIEKSRIQVKSRSNPSCSSR